MLQRTRFSSYLVIFIFCSKSFVKTFVPPNESSLIFYYGSSFNDSKRFQFENATDILEDPQFKSQEETHLYFHGWKESQTSASRNVPVTVNAYLKRNDINLITLDWAKAASGEYAEVVAENMEPLANELADVVLSMFNAGLDRMKLTVVAHALGAQLAGMMGRKIISKTQGNTKIYRMALLDASFLLFEFNSVNRNDAEFVQAIHTEIVTFGQPFPIGHVDFYPNGGYEQPGCTNGFIIFPFDEGDICSHRRSWRFWAESVENVNGTNPKFLGVAALSYYGFLMGEPFDLKNESVEMGIDCQMSARGSYYLKTNSKSPFAKGEDGY